MSKISPQSITQTIANRIDQYRCQNNLSIRQLSKKSGVAGGTLSYIFQGKVIPNIYTLLCLCQAMDLPLNALFVEDEEQFAANAKETLLLKIYRELSPMSQDTLIKLAKCMR